MTTLGELMTKFASVAGDEPASITTPPPKRPAAAGTHPNQKLASEGESHMNSLQDIYVAMTGMDNQKTAAAAAQIPVETPPTGDDVDFAAMAEKLAGDEAAEQVAAEAGGDIDFMKVAAEYDSAGRIMARGFYDEFSKLAGNMNTTVADNQNTESPSASKTPALGERGLPTLETNFAGSDNHDKQPAMTGAEPKNTYKDSLKTSKTISAGQGTGDDPEGSAISMGGGSPVGFATIRDLKA